MSLTPNIVEIHNEPQKTEYIKDKEFSNLGAVAVILLDPTRTRVLLMGRRDKFYLALPSGKETLAKHPNHPEKSASDELKHETGLELEVEPFQTYKSTLGGPKVGYYFSIIDEETFEREFLNAEPPRDPTKEPKRPPAWLPIDLVLSGKISLPFEQGIALEDFLKQINSGE